MTQPPVQDPRRLALSLLNRLDREQITLDALLTAATDDIILLSRRDTALMYALVYGVLRWRGRLDWIIGHFSRTPLKKIDPNVRNILRLGLYQMLFMDRIPVSAAVNTAVEMAKADAPKWIAGFVNGLLRNATRKADGVPYPSLSDSPVTAVAVIHSFPEWLVRRWMDRFGQAETEKFCEAVNHIPPLTLRVNTLCISRSSLRDILTGALVSVEETRYAPDGLRISGPTAAIPDLPGFTEGYFQVQDEAAQLVGCLVSPEPGERVLDACAGLGGKTGHLAMRMKNRGELIAMDRSADKLARLQEEMNRLGITSVTPQVHDLEDPPDPDAAGMFDRILLDAPCSGLGVLRRNPDGKWSVRKKDMNAYKARQIRFLRHLAPLVRPGGRLVYAVCTFEPEETDQVVEAFLKAVPDFLVEQIPTDLPTSISELQTTGGFLRTFPHRHDMDGFFGVCFRRNP